MIRHWIVALTLTLVAHNGAAKSLSDNLNSLGVNQEVVRKARKMNPNNKVKVVQKRAVDRTWRLEGSVGYGFLTGGSPYVDSTQTEGSLELHITPRWSIGGRYYNFNNELSKEGKRVFAESEQTGVAPDVRDFAKNAYLGSVTFYPLYGKVNLFNLSVTQFDIYMSAGFGQIELDRTGATDLLSFAGGVGFWLTNWLTSRFEIRYQTYEDTVGESQRRRLDQTIFTVKLGFLL